MPTSPEHRDRLASEWAAECVQRLPDASEPGSLLADARQSFMLWLMDHGIDHPTGQRDDGKRWLKAQGHRTRRVDGETRWAGLHIALPEDWGVEKAAERPRTAQDGLGEATPEGQPQERPSEASGASGGPLTVASALRSLVNNGLITQEEAKRAWERAGHG